MTPEVFWTEKGREKVGGRDHLGLQSVSSTEIFGQLSPYINALTFHARYQSFFTFLLYEFWARDLPQTYSSWVDFFRPRDFFYSLAMQMCDRDEHQGMGSIVGSDGTRPIANRDGGPYTYYEKYIKARLAGYGLYYRSTVSGLGLMAPSGTRPGQKVDYPSEDTGRALALAFREAVADTTYLREYFEHPEAAVPRGVLVEYARAACLCQLHKEESPDREPLRRAYLEGGWADGALARTQSLRLFLDLTQQTDGIAVDWLGFRQLLYYGESDAGATFMPQEDLLDWARRWRWFQAREYYVWALESLWVYLCEWGLNVGGDGAPVSMAAIWDHLAEALDFDALAGKLGLPQAHLGPNSSLDELLAWIRETGGGGNGGFDEACRLGSALNEHRVYALAAGGDRGPSVMVAGALTVLGLLLLRFDLPELKLRSDWEMTEMGGRGRLSIAGFFGDVARLRGQGTVTLSSLVHWLVQRYVIHQHLLVASTKLPDNTFRFEPAGQGLRFRRFDDDLGLRDSRFAPFSNHVHELGFCGRLGDAQHPLTDDGATLLESGAL